MAIDSVPGKSMSARTEESQSLPVYQSYRLQKIYIVAAMLIMTGLLQLVMIKCVQIILIDSLPVPNFLWIFISLVCLLLMVFTELFNKFPIDWTLGVIAVESVTLCSVSYKWNHLPAIYAASILTGVLILQIGLYAMGAYMHLMFLPNYYVMLYISIVFIIMHIFFDIVLYALGNPNLKVIIDLWALIYMIPLILYTATLIHQRRLPDMVSEEYVLSATIIAAFYMFAVFLITNCITYIGQLGGHVKHMSVIHH